MTQVTHLQAEKANQSVRDPKDREATRMDAIVNKLAPVDQRPSREEAEDAVRVLLRWAGDDPDREGLLDTPKRVAKAYRELFSGYDADIEDVLGTTF